MPSFHRFSQCQEIKACIELLLELINKSKLSLENDGNLVLERLNELYSYAEQLNHQEMYHPLLDIKHYFNQTKISYEDECNQQVHLPLSKAIELLRASSENWAEPSLLQAVVKHIQNELNESSFLYDKLKEVSRYQ